MTMHNYSYDLNNILSKANEKGFSHVEGFTLNLDNLLHEEVYPPSVDKLVELTVEFLQNVVNDYENYEDERNDY